MRRYRTIGILGGMGPQATAELYLRIIRLFQSRLGAVDDSDYPEIIILSLPIPDVVGDLKEPGLTRDMLMSGARRLEDAGASFIAIPCNTVSIFMDDMRKAVRIPMLNVIDETAKMVKRKGLSCAGLLATKTTINSRLYDKSMPGMSIITLDEVMREETSRLIMEILSGRIDGDVEDGLYRQVSALRGLGAQEVILGCTELPLALKGCEGTLDTLDILAEAAFLESIGERD